MRRVINKINSLWRYLPFIGRNSINRRNRRNLKNRDFTIISSNCNGGVIYHDLGLKFDSPFINLYILPEDYLKLLSSLEYYLSLELVEDRERKLSFPVGVLGDIHIYFQHYKSFNEAKDIWQRRVLRIHKDNIFVMFSDRDGCTKKQIELFDALPFQNKICFVHDLKNLEGIKSVHLIEGFETKNEVGVLSDFKYKNLQRRYLDDFDYVKWLNKDLCEK